MLVVTHDEYSMNYECDELYQYIATIIDASGMKEQIIVQEDNNSERRSSPSSRFWECEFGVVLVGLWSSVSVSRENRMNE
jgi:hypothetical protein